MSEERLQRLANAKAFKKLSDGEKEDVLDVLMTLPDRLFTTRDVFEKELSKALKAESVKIAAPVKKAILNALSERDETADICRDKEGNPEPDTDLRDHELVPLKEDWRDYVAREVTPFVPDAWVDESYTDATDKQVGRVGYRPRRPEDYDRPSALDKALVLEFIKTTQADEWAIRLEQVKRNALDDEMAAVLKNNPPDVSRPAFMKRLLEETIKQYQRDSSLQNIIMTNAEDRDQIFAHLFSRALREVGSVSV